MDLARDQMQRSWERCINQDHFDALRRPRAPPNDSNGCPENWDIESGCWRDASGETRGRKLESPVTPHEPIRKSVVFPRDGTIRSPCCASQTRDADRKWTRFRSSQPSGTGIGRGSMTRSCRTAAAEVVLFMSRGTGLWSLNVCPRLKSFTQ